MRLKVEINDYADERGAVADTLRMIARQIEQGYRQGFDSNDDQDYNYVVEETGV